MQNTVHPVVLTILYIELKWTAMADTSIRSCAFVAKCKQTRTLAFLCSRCGWSCFMCRAGLVFIGFRRLKRLIPSINLARCWLLGLRALSEMPEAQHLFSPCIAMVAESRSSQGHTPGGCFF